jgi:hypothetical protein
MSLSISPDHSKSSAVRVGEREFSESSNHPTKTAAAARHAQFELDDYNGPAREEESDEVLDAYGSKPSDRRDMTRMGKEQEFRVRVTWSRIYLFLLRDLTNECREYFARYRYCLLQQS